MGSEQRLRLKPGVLQVIDDKMRIAYSRDRYTGRATV